jgi:hypothetical protein
MYKPEKIKVKGERVEICILNLTYKFMKANAYQQARFILSSVKLLKRAHCGIRTKKC